MIIASCAEEKCQTTFLYFFILIATLSAKKNPSERFPDIDLALSGVGGAGRVNFGQPSSLTLIKRITAKMSILVTIKAIKCALGLERSSPVYKVSLALAKWFLLARKMRKRVWGYCSYTAVISWNIYFMFYNVNNLAIDALRLISNFSSLEFAIQELFPRNKISPLIFARLKKKLTTSNPSRVHIS